MKRTYKIITVAALILTSNLAQAADPVYLATSPTWGGRSQHHADLVVWYDSSNQPNPYTALQNGVLTTTTANSIPPGEITISVNLIKPNGTQWPVEAVACDRDPMGTSGFIFPTQNLRTGAQTAGIGPGSYCRIRVDLDKSEAVIGKLKIELVDPQAQIKDTLRASLEIRDVNDNALARSELR